MESLSIIQQRNRELAQKINEGALRNPQSPYFGKFVGIANGQVVVTADSMDDAVRRLREVEPDPQRLCCVEAGVDYNEVQYIWRAS